MALSYIRYYFYYFVLTSIRKEEAAAFFITPKSRKPATFHQRQHNAVRPLPECFYMTVEDDDTTTKVVQMTRHVLLSMTASMMGLPCDFFSTPPMMEPPSTKKHHVKLISTLFSKYSTNQTAVYHIPQSDVQLMNVNSAEKDPSIYGEITQLGARQLFYYLRMLHGQKNIQFADLGCGSGQLVLQAYLEIPLLTLAYGIELSPTRLDIAIQTWEQMQMQAVELRQTLTGNNTSEAIVDFQEGDLLQLEKLPQKFSHVYIASLCFTKQMMEQLEGKLICSSIKNKKLQCIATLQEFPSIPFSRQEYIEMTWTKPYNKGCLVYFYDL